MYRTYEEAYRVWEEEIMEADHRARQVAGSAAESLLRAQIAKDMADEQARVERIFGEIEEQFFAITSDNELVIQIAKDNDRTVTWWQALKEREGIT